MRRLAVACAVGCLAFGGCGGGDSGGSSESGNSGSAGASAVPNDPRLHTGPPRERIEAMFELYNGALVKRDYATACALLAPESVDSLLEKLKQAGREADSCEDGFKTAYGSAPESETKVLDEVARTARVRKITVSGQTAKIEWSAEANGRTFGITHGARQVGADWKLVDTGDAQPKPE